MPNKKSQKLTLCLTTEVKDVFGVYILDVLINEKLYTYLLNSEFAVRQFKKLLRHKRPGKALNILKQFKMEVTNDTD